MTISTPTTPTKQETSTGAEAFLSGKLAQVDIARIEKELKALWQSASDSGEGSSVTRSCAINLILYSEDNDAETVAAEVLDDIATHHPCRAILAISRAADKPALEAWVSARCHLTDSKTHKQICCEQITVRSEGNGPQNLASVVLPLVISDLPVFLWWRAKTVSLANVKPFLPSVDELIIDSQKDEGVANFFADVMTVVKSYLKEKEQAHIVVSDLNWRRCLLWREALALAFDEKANRLPLSALKQIQKIQIAYGAGGSERTGGVNQALLYVGWLANRLQWKFKSASAIQNREQEPDQKELDESKNAFNIKLSAGEREIELQLRGTTSDESSYGNITSIDVSFIDASLSSISIGKTPGVPGVNVLFNGADGKCETMSHNEAFKVYQVSEARLIDLELENCDRDLILESSFKIAAKIANELFSRA